MIQTRLPIFDDTTFGELLVHMGLTHYEVIPQNRLKRSWRISRKGKKITLSVPSPFSNAPEEIKRALLQWAHLIEKNGFKRQGILTELHGIEKSLYQFLYDNQHITKHRAVRNPAKQFKNSQGVSYDLQPLFDNINTTYFDGTLSSWLRWGKNGSRTSYHSKFSTHDGINHDLITIAGIYNRPTVPQFALEAVLYHEMLHIASPPRGTGARRHVHHQEFRALEKAFPHYDAWQQWLRKGVVKKGWFR